MRLPADSIDTSSAALWVPIVAAVGIISLVVFAVVIFSDKFTKPFRIALYVSGGLAMSMAASLPIASSADHDREFRQSQANVMAMWKHFPELGPPHEFKRCVESVADKTYRTCTSSIVRGDQVSRIRFFRRGDDVTYKTVYTQTSAPASSPDRRRGLLRP